MRIATPATAAEPPGTFPDSLPVEQALYEAEAAILYVTRNLQGQMLLAYLADESIEGTATLLAPLSANDLRDLKAGTLPIRDALVSSRLWLHMRTKDASNVWPIKPDELPSDHLPMPGTNLYPERETPNARFG